MAVVILGENASAEIVAALRGELGLNRPWYEQYGNWMTGLPRGDLGESYALGYDIGSEIRKRMGPTVLLTVGSLALSIPVALILGVYSALNAKRRRGIVVDVGAQIGVAVPNFLAGSH